MDQDLLDLNSILIKWSRINFFWNNRWGEKLPRLYLNFCFVTLHKDLWIYGQNTQIVKYIAGGTQNPYSFTNTQYVLDFFFGELFFYEYKSWGHDPIWHFSCLRRKFSELRTLIQGTKKIRSKFNYFRSCCYQVVKLTSYTLRQNFWHGTCTFEIYWTLNPESFKYCFWL